MDRLFKTLLLALSTTISVGQVQADSISIYKNFSHRGTTASLWHYHHDADSLKIPLLKLTQDDLDSFKRLTSGAKQKKDYHRKHGNVFFGFIYFNGQAYKCTFSDYSKEFSLINLSARRQLTIRDSLISSQINNILKKYQ